MPGFCKGCAVNPTLKDSPDGDLCKSIHHACLRGWTSEALHNDLERLDRLVRATIGAYFLSDRRRGY